MEWVRRCLLWGSRCHKEEDFCSLQEYHIHSRFHISPVHILRGHHHHLHNLKCRGIVLLALPTQPDQLQGCSCLTFRTHLLQTHTNHLAPLDEDPPQRHQYHSKMQACTAGFKNTFRSPGLRLGQVKGISSNISNNRRRVRVCLFNPALHPHSLTSSRNSLWLPARREA